MGRDAELAQLRQQISSLYPKGLYEVRGINKWKGRKEIEDSVKKFVELNGEYRTESFTLLGVNMLDVRKVLTKFTIDQHPRIPALNGQFGVKALCDIPKNTCFGQYFGAEMSQDAFSKVFDGTGEEHDHNIYAFDQKIDPIELKKLKQKKKKMAMERKQRMNKQKNKMMQKQYDEDIMDDDDDEKEEEKIFIIDPFI